MSSVRYCNHSRTTRIIGFADNVASVPSGEDDEGKYAVTSIRRLGALALAVPLAVGAFALGPGATAQEAGSGIKSPAGNAVITSGSTTTVTAHLNALVTGNLYVRGPGTSDQKIGGGIGPKDISGSVHTGRNGAYVVTLKGLLGTIDQRTFYVRVPPARPSGVDASLSEHKMVVRWDRGHESDLTGYDVFVGSSRQRRGTPGALCAEEVCSTALSLPASGGRVDVGVRALRSNGSGGTVASGLSTTPVMLPAASALPGGRAPLAGGLPSATANPLLPLPGKSPLLLPTVAPDGQTPGFQYPTPGPQVANPAAASPKTENASSNGVLRWGKSVALALILLIVAAHLGAWSRRLRLAQASATESATAARSSAGTSGAAERARDAAAGAPDTAGSETPGHDTETPPLTAPRTYGRGSIRTPSGRLIDAKGTVADAVVLTTNGDSRRPAGRSDDDLVDDAPGVPAASDRAALQGAAYQGGGKARSSHSKPGRSHTRRSSGYRGRRRAD